MRWIIAKKDGRLGQAPERRKESFEWETLAPYIGRKLDGFSEERMAGHPGRRIAAAGAPSRARKSPAWAGLCLR